MESSEKEALLREQIDRIIEGYKAKGTVPDEVLVARLQKFDLEPEDIEYIYSEIEKAGIRITYSDEEEASRPDAINKLLSDVSVDDAVTLYLRDIGSYPLLSVEEEKELAKRMMEGDESAKRRLAEVYGR